MLAGAIVTGLVTPVFAEDATEKTKVTYDANSPIPIQVNYKAKEDSKENSYVRIGFFTTI